MELLLKTLKMAKGRLFLIPCGLGGDNESEILPKATIEATNQLTEFIVEKEKTARHFLKRIGYPHSLNDLVLHPLNKHTSEQEIPSYLKSAEEGRNIGLISEAGCPAVADPGAVAVEIAHRQNIEVVPLVGPSSILLGLMASGKSGQSFVFHGYLPKDKSERIQKIKQMESATRKGQTQIFMETPFRNNALLEDLLVSLNNQSVLTIATNLQTPKQLIQSKTVEYLKKRKPDLAKKPTVFYL